MLAVLIVWPAARWEGVNARVRYATTVQIVEHGTLELGEFAKSTTDKSVIHGRAYSDKAPGLSFVLVPFYSIARLVTTDFRWGRHLTRLLSLTLAALLTLRAWRRRMVRDGLSEADRMTCLAFFGVGTVAWVYWSMLYSHGATALCVFWGARLLMDYKQEDSEPKLALAGAAFGLAILLEYPTALLGGMAGLYLLSFERRPRRVILFAALGAIVPGLLLSSYNAAIFGDPFSTGYQFESLHFFRERHAWGFMGIGPPSSAKLWRILGSPAKGLVYWSPAVLAGAAAVAWMVRRRRAEGLFLATQILAYLVVLSGYYDPSGGTCVGPRHLVPLIGLLALALAAWLPHAAPMAKGVTRALVVSGSVLAGIGALTQPHVYEAFVNPINEFLVPLTISGYGAGNILGLPDAVATIIALALLALLAILLAVRGAAEDPRSFRRGMIDVTAVLFACGLFYFAAAPRLWTTEEGTRHASWADYWSAQKQWGPAVDEYAAAYRIHKDPYLLFNRIKALAQLGRLAEMKETQAQLESDFPGFLQWVLKNGE